MTDVFGTQTVSQAVGNFIEGFAGSKPLFSGGVQIGNWQVGGGYFDTNAQDVLGSLCQKIVTLNDNLTADQLDPTTWYTYGDWDQMIRAQDYCLSKGLIPSWMGQADLNQYQTNADGSITPIGQAPPSIAVPLAIAGGLILLSVILIARR